MIDLNLSSHNRSKATNKQVDPSVAHVSRHGETYESWKGDSRGWHKSHRDEANGWQEEKLGNEPCRGTREDSANTDVSWTSSDLDQEYLDSGLKARNSQASFTTKLNKYSSELLINR